MKRILYLIVLILFVLVNAVLLWHFVKPESLDSLISYEVPEGWTEESRSCWRDDGKTVSEIIYVKGDGFMAISIFSYRGRTPYGTWEKAKEYLESLDGVESFSVDGRDSYIGWRGMDDVGRVNRDAYIFDGKYVFEVYLANSDEKVTGKQQKAMMKLIKSIKFN